MSTIQIRTPHVSSDTAYAQVAERYGHTEVDPATAVTIASFWQSSGSIGSVLASFASGAAVDRDALLDDIAATRRVEGYYYTGAIAGAPRPKRMAPRDRDALDLLSTFVINYQR